MAAVLLRRIVVAAPDELIQLDTVLLNACRSELLIALKTEPDICIRRKICDAVAELARTAIGLSEI